MAKSKNLDQQSKLEPGDIRFNSSKILLWLGIITIVIVLVSIAGQMLKYLTVYDEAFGLIPLTNIAHALSIPTIYTVLLLFISSLLLALISALKHTQKDKFRWQWSFLSFVFFYMSMNKGTAMHSLVTRPLRKFLRINFPDVSRSNLSITVTFLILVFLIFYVKFLLSLPKRTKILVLLSLAVYLAGFRGVDAIADNYAALYDKQNLIYTILIILKKGVEVSGMVLALYTILDFLDRNIPRIKLKL